MKEILLTSSVLILTLLLLRTLFRKTISRRVQYALWGLVLLRLLIPVNLPALRHNVLTAAIHTSGSNQYTARHTHRSRLHSGSRCRAWVVSWARTCRNVSGDSTAAGVR